MQEQTQNSVGVQQVDDLGSIKLTEEGIKVHVPVKIVLNHKAPPKYMMSSKAPTMFSKIIIPRPKVSHNKVANFKTKIVNPVKNVLHNEVANFNTKPVNTVKDVELRPWQIEWANKAKDILAKNPGYIDTSRMRSGKTYVTLWLAKQYNFRLLIICPPIAIDGWKRAADEYSVEVIDIISYQSLRSQKDHKPKHRYLDRYDHVSKGGSNKVHFSPTQDYLNLIDQNTMIICDEIQNIKNNTDQYKACNALINPIISKLGRSRFCLLSGTPFDKEIHSVNLLRLIGYIKSDRLYNYIREKHELVLEGIQELIDACKCIDVEETMNILTEIPITKNNMTTLCYTLYIRVVKKNISGAMSAPTDITGTLNVCNGFYNMTEEKDKELKDAINNLSQAVRFTDTVINIDNIGAVIKALVQIENAKVEAFARVATKSLIANPNLKVVISVNYTSTINAISNLLSIFDPLLLYGTIPANKRADIVRSFNEDPNRRVFIMNTAVGGVGISLYSQENNSDRLMLISPSYKLLEITQAASRIYGPGMTSSAVVRMFYGRSDGLRETGILTSLSSKTKVLSGTLDETVARDLILPGDYPVEEETD